MSAPIRDDELAAAVSERVDFEMRTHFLKQAHAQLSKARNEMKMATYAVGHPYIADIEKVIVNGVEPILWQIEQEVITRQKGKA